MSLTDLQIKKLKAPDQGQKTYFDDRLKGFGVRVSQGGSKSFVVLYGPKRKRKTIGRYPEMTLAEARTIAKRTQAEIALDDGTTELPSSSISFTEARDAFLRDSDERTRERTAQEYRRLLLRHFDINKPISEVTRQDIVNPIDTLKRTPSEQKHAFVAVRTMFNWCRKRGLIETSPVPPLTFKSQSRSRILSDHELCAVWRRAEAFGYPYGPIVQLLILTGQRRGEIAALRRSWIRDHVIHFPGSVTKNGRDHTLPLGSSAMTVIEGLPDLGDLIFPSRLSDERSFNGWSKCKRKFDQELGFCDYTLHDLRRTFSSNLAKMGVPIHLTERLLNHVSGTMNGVAGIYNRYSYSAEMADAINEYETRLRQTWAKNDDL